MENIILFTAKQWLGKYKVTKLYVRRSRVNACNLSDFKGIPFILSQIICWMYIKRSCNFHQIPSQHAWFYDLVGQPLYVYISFSRKDYAQLK